MQKYRMDMSCDGSFHNCDSAPPSEQSAQPTMPKKKGKNGKKWKKKGKKRAPPTFSELDPPSNPEEARHLIRTAVADYEEDRLDYERLENLIKETVADEFGLVDDVEFAKEIIEIVYQTFECFKSDSITRNKSVVECAIRCQLAQSDEDDPETNMFAHAHQDLKRDRPFVVDLIRCFNGNVLCDADEALLYSKELVLMALAHNGTRVFDRLEDDCDDSDDEGYHQDEKKVGCVSVLGFGCDDESREVGCVYFWCWTATHWAANTPPASLPTTRMKLRLCLVTQHSRRRLVLAQTDKSQTNRLHFPFALLSLLQPGVLP